MDSLSLFEPSIKKWFKDNLGTPTIIQEKGWPLIAGGRDILLSAPTGTGKTLAAFLWAIDRLCSGSWETGKTSVLYVSPMKALNNDVKKNLLLPLEGIRSSMPGSPLINVLVRSGDTDPRERRRMITHPPEILITTPESLNILLTSRNSFYLFQNLKTVILDEIHAVAGNKRGTLLISSVERLARLSGGFQRIALSATVRPLETIARWAGGGKALDIAEANESKRYEIHVAFPPGAPLLPAGESRWPLLIEEFKKLIKNSSSTLLFANSRRLTEKTARLINENEDEIIAYSHHGSISKELRLEVEDKLKKGKLKAIVATSSLELGIDIGELDRVILIETPRSITSALQRIGRAGHKVGLTSRGFLYPTHGRDFIDAAVMAKAVEESVPEPLMPIECPLDILSQLIMSMCAVEDWDINRLYDFLRSIYPYRNLTERQYRLVLDMLGGRYADSRIKELNPRIFADKLENTLKAREGAASLVYLSGGTIPDRGYYTLRLAGSDSRIGELDEEFVWERKLGDTFSLGPAVWRIQNITASDVEVVPVDNAPNIIPFWKAEEFDRNFYLCEKTGLFLDMAGEMLKDPDNFISFLESGYHMDETSSRELTVFLQSQIDATRTALPGRRHLLAEHIRSKIPGNNSRIVLHTLWGGRVNRPLSYVISALWLEIYGYPIEIMANDDNILIMIPHKFDLNEIFEKLYSSDIEDLLRKSLENTLYFGARFRENAGRALLLPRSGFHGRVPLWLNRLRSKKLLEAVRKYGDFPITVETWRECLKDDFDLENLKKLLAELKNSEIKIGEAYTSSPSPFCGGIIWRQKNKYVYEDDTPSGSPVSSIRGDLFREILNQTGIRPRIPAETVIELDRKLKRTYTGYTIQSAGDLSAWVEERLLISENEWDDLAESCRAAGSDVNAWLAKLGERIVSIKPPGVEKRIICASSNIPFIAVFYGLPDRELDIRSLPGAAYHTVLKTYPDSLLNDKSNFLLQWISYYAVVETLSISRMLGISETSSEQLLDSLSESGDIVIDKLVEGSEGNYASHRSNLESLLRLLHRERQVSFKAMPLENLQLFLASRQGLLGNFDSMEGLKACLERLFGYPLEAQAWEESVFPSRLSPYYTSWLDSLLQNTGLIWFGSGKRKLSFAFPEDLSLFKIIRSRREETIILEEDRRYSFFEIASIFKTTTEKVSEQIWELVWKGVLSNDSFESVRKGIQNNFTPFKISEEMQGGRHQYRRWESSRPVTGRWFVTKGNNGPRDLIEETETQKDRARILLDRYGVVFRELIGNETAALRWSDLLRTFRLMELSGEILSGHFFDGISGLQFASHEAFRQLGEGLPEDKIYWFCAADPASLCGIGLKTPAVYPKRIRTNYLVFHGAKLVLTVTGAGKSLDFKVGPDNPSIEAYLGVFKAFLNREFNPMQSVIVERINSMDAVSSPYGKALKNYGFRPGYKGLELWRY